MIFIQANNILLVGGLTPAFQAREGAAVVQGMPHLRR